MEGRRVIVTEAGIREEYSPAGQILFHTTPEGYRYAHSFEKARRAVTAIAPETALLPDGTTFTVDVPTVTLR